MDAQSHPVALIWEAISNDDVAEAGLLLERHPEWVNAHIPYGGGTFLHLAASLSSAGMIEALLLAGFDIDGKGELDGDTALVAGCAHGNYETVKCLLERGASLDTTTSSRNPLFAAIVGRSATLTALLLERGIDPAVRYSGDTMDGMDATAFAMERGEREIAGMIAQWRSNGDSARADALLVEADEVAARNNTPGHFDRD